MIFQRHINLPTLSRLLDGMLDVDLRDKVRAHLAGCVSCRHRKEGIERVRTALRNIPPLDEHPLQQLERPLFIPVVRPAFPVWGFTAGTAAGLLLIITLLLLRPIPMPMRVVAASESSIRAGILQDSELQPGQPLNTLTPGDVDMEIPGRVLFRLRPGSTVTWQERNRLWILGGRSHIVLSVMRGEVLARTKEGFWGSKLEIHTPTANATVRGTAFSVKVDPGADATKLSVLAGSVFFSPYLDRIGVNVGSGQASQIQGTGMPNSPEPLLPAEKKALLETYRIGEDPRIALVVGAGPERVEELLQPALLFIGGRHHPELQRYTRSLVREINEALIQGNMDGQEKNIQSLELAIREITDSELAVPLRLFTGACRARMGQHSKAYTQFRWVSEIAPHHPLASLALAAMGITAEKQMRNPELARISFEQILARYPKSPEAVVAQEFFRRQPIQDSK